MLEQKENVGTLYLCATPIGNLEDITFRVVRTLKEVDLIAAEDTRNSRKLLNVFEIDTPMTSYHEYNKVEKGQYLVQELLAGKSIALITDAGTPGISDPGELLVEMCVEAGVPVTSLPGPAAVITALTISGLPTRRFAFEAFLPNDKKEMERYLEELRDEYRTVILYEAPHRLVKTLGILEETLGKARRIAVCRELTKKHEQVYRGTIAEAKTHFEEEPPRGECVLVIEGASYAEAQEKRQKQWEELTISEHMERYLSTGMDKKSAMKQVAQDRGVSKRDIYQALLEIEE